MEVKQEALDAVVRKLAVAGHEVTTAQARDAITAFLSAGGYALVHRTNLIGDDSFNTDLPFEDTDPSERAYRSLVVIASEMNHHADRLKSTKMDEEAHYTAWKEFYNRCFGMDQKVDLRCWSDQVHAALEIMNRRFPDYYHPDTSYEEDVQSWHEAFKELMAALSNERIQLSEKDAAPEWWRQ